MFTRGSNKLHPAFLSPGDGDKFSGINYRSKLPLRLPYTLPKPPGICAAQQKDRSEHEPDMHPDKAGSPLYIPDNRQPGRKQVPYQPERRPATANFQIVRSVKGYFCPFALSRPLPPHVSMIIFPVRDVWFHPSNHTVRPMV